MTPPDAAKPLPAAAIPLPDSDEALRLAVQEAGLAFWDADLATGEAIWSESHFRILGYVPTPGGEATVEMWRACVHAEDLPGVLAAIETARRQRGLYTREHRICRADTGEVRWLRVFGRFLDDQSGVAQRFVGAFFDDTERHQTHDALRQAEALYRALVEQLPAVTYLASLDANLPANYVSPQIAEWGFSPAAWLADPDSWVRQLHPEDRERVLAEFAAGIAARAPINCEYRLLDSHGAAHWVKDRAVVVAERAGRPIALQGVLLDIAERKRHEAEAALYLGQMQALRRRTETAVEDERRRIAREVHDELGQELTVLKIELALLRAELAENVPAQARLAGLEAQVTSTLGKVRRIASELRPGVLDSLGLVAAIEWQTREFERRTGIACELALPREEPEVESARATALFRIFQEILTNIARHADATQVDVCATVAMGNLLIEVSDNGRGFADAATAPGTSLGMLGMRERAREFGGMVEFASAPGRGTQVSLALPLVPSILKP